MVANGSAQFHLFDPKGLRLKPSQLPSVTLPITPCVCALSLHPQHSLLLWCIGVAAHAGLIACVRCSDGRVMSRLSSPCPALAAPSSTFAAAALDDLACVAIACSNGALATAALSSVSGGAEQGIDVAVLVPAAASVAAADAQGAGKKRNKQQQQQQQQDGHVCIAAIEPCNVCVAWSSSATCSPSAAVYDCSFGSCRASISLASFDASAALAMHHSSPLLLISDDTSIFTCDTRGLARQVSLADAIATHTRQPTSTDAVFTHAVERIQDMCLSSSSSSSAAAAAAATHDTTAGSVTPIDSSSLLSAWQQQLQDCTPPVTCSMVIKRLVSPSTAAAFVTAAAAAGNWTDVMACVRGGGVALSHCPTLVADAAAASQAAIILECLLRCVDVLEADVACALTFALHSGTPAAFQALAHYIASAPSASASAAAPSAAAATKKSKGKSAEKSSGTGPSAGATTTGSGSVDAARRSLLHAALRARVSEVSMMPLLRAIPQRALVRLMRYLRSLMTNDAAAAEANAVGGGKDCDALPSLQRVVEWTSMCMDAVGLQVSQRCCCCC